MISERIRKEFGSIAGRIESEPSKNKAFLQSHYKSLSHYLEENFGITSGKLRESFGKASGKKLPNPINTLIIIAIFPEATAIQIGKILGVSDRSVETYIQKLKSEGMIDREGGKKEGSWQIKFLK